MSRQEFSADELRDWLLYEPVSGSWSWRRSPRGRTKVGAPAGYTDPQGYLHIGFRGRLFKAHRLAWLYMTGEWPVGEIDHESTDPSDNSWNNIRQASRVQNAANTKAHKDNSTGFKGVSVEKKTGRYCARLLVQGRRFNLGQFDTAEAASDAYRDAAKQHFGEFARW